MRVYVCVCVCMHKRESVCACMHVCVCVCAPGVLTLVNQATNQFKEIGTLGRPLQVIQLNMNPPLT